MATETLKVLTTDAAGLMAYINTQNKKPTGADYLRAAAQLGQHTNARVVIVADQIFNSSSYGYAGKAVLVDTSAEKIPVEHRLVGINSIPIKGNTFAVLKPDAAIKFVPKD